MSPAQTDPIPSLSPRGAPENLPAGEEAGRGKRVCPGGEYTPPHPCQDHGGVWLACPEGGGSVRGVTNTRSFGTDPDTPPRCPPSAGRVRSLTPAVHTDRSAPGLPSRPPCARPPLPCQQLFTSWSPLPLSDPPSVFTPLVGTSGQVSGVSPIHHVLTASPPEEWRKASRGSLGGEGSVQLGQGEGWATGCLQ